MLRDVVQRFLRRVRFADLLGPALGVKGEGLALQRDGYLCAELLVAAVGLPVHGEGSLPLLEHLLHAADWVLVGC